MRPTQLLAPLAASCLTLACGAKDPTPAPAPVDAAPAPAADTSPAPADAAPAPADTAPAPADTAPAPADTAPAADAAAPTTCETDATVLDLVGTPVGDYVAVVKHATRAEVADADAAKDALSKTYSVYLDTPDALVTYIQKDVEDPAMNLYVRGTGDKGFVVFTNFHERAAEHQDVKSAMVGERFLVVSVAEEFHERVPACLNDEVDEEDCEGTATGDAGEAYTHYVVDRDAARVVFAYGYGRDADAACEGAKAPSLVDQTWSVSNCSGASESFTLAQIAPCTRAVQEKRQADTHEAEAKKRADEEKAQVARRLPEAEVQAMVNEGRKLTSDKEYAAAIATFDKVIDTNPDTVLAHTGRAFALLSRAEGKDLELAEAGFDAAYQLTKAASERDDKLRSQIMFNRGLIAEKQGKADLARRFFQKAHDLSPSPATKKKLGE